MIMIEKTLVLIIFYEAGNMRPTQTINKLTKIYPVLISGHIGVNSTNLRVKPLSVMIYLMRGRSLDHEVGRLPVI